MSSKALAGRFKAKANTCRQFESTGECRFESECKFVHRPKAASVEVSPSVPKKKRPARGKKKITKTDSNPRSHLQAFFDKYPDFDYNPSLPVMQEFYRMRDMLWPGRDRDDSERNEAYGGLRDALVQQFNSIYGTDERSLAAWQRLCVVLQLEDIPEDLDACRELVRSTDVNLVDLVDTSTTGAPVCLFWSERACFEHVYYEYWEILSAKPRLRRGAAQIFASSNHQSWRRSGSSKSENDSSSIAY